MKIKKIAAVTLSAVVVGGTLAAGIYYALTRDPTPIKVDPQTAVDTPAFVGHASDVEQDTFDPKVLDGVRELGMRINVQSSKETGMTRGYWVGIQIDPAGRRMKGGVSRGLEGQVAGY